MRITPTRFMGTTRGGQSIYIYMTKDETVIRNFLYSYTKHDHFDAMAVYQFLAIKALRKYGRLSEQFTEFSKYIDGRVIHMSRWREIRKANFPV